MGIKEDRIEKAREFGKSAFQNSLQALQAMGAEMFLKGGDSVIREYLISSVKELDKIKEIVATIEGDETQDWSRLEETQEYLATEISRLQELVDSLDRKGESDGKTK